MQITIHLWKDFTEYEYRIYLFLPILPNMNIEYIRSLQLGRIWISNIFKTRKLKIRIRIYDIRWLLFEYSNFRINSCYTAPCGLSEINCLYAIKINFTLEMLPAILILMHISKNICSSKMAFRPREKLYVFVIVHPHKKE